MLVHDHCLFCAPGTLLQAEKQNLRSSGQMQHFRVDIEDYKLDSSSYVRNYCKKHVDVEVTKACESCLTLFCTSCLSPSAPLPPCKDGGRQDNRLIQLLLDKISRYLADKEIMPLFQGNHDTTITKSCIQQKQNNRICHIGLYPSMKRQIVYKQNLL